MEILYFLFIVFFIIRVISNTQTNPKIMNFLKNECNLKNVVYKTSKKNGRILTGLKQGEEYIVFTNYLYSAINKNIIYDIKSKMNKEHFHSGIIIVNNANTIKQETKKLASENGIEIYALNSKQIYKSNNTSNNVVKQTSRKYSEDDPIQSGSKANTIWNNFFGNKIERL